MSKNHPLRSRHVALLLLIASAAVYFIDYHFFGHGGDIAAGFLANLAFLPVYVLFVTLMIERVLKERERHALRQKLNMVIGVFFSEVGTKLLGDSFSFLVNGDELARLVKITPQWTEADFRRVADYVTGHDIQVDSRRGDLQTLRSFLLARRGFMLGLLENPNLLEHDDFTDLLWAVFHLIEELEARRSFDRLPAADMEHLSGDIKRAYRHLLRQWVVYLIHLRHDYPYLFSLAVRTNPLNPDAHAEIVDT
ncbi:MAG TPA: hypothetical protein VI389_11035 [Geobacteraceae bacterium]